MSTQQTHSTIPFSFSTPQTPFRLLELPQEILELIENPQSAASLSSQSQAPALYLKSTPNTHAVLCTAHKTYQLRQVQTSNSLYLLKPLLTTTTISPPPAVIPNTTTTTTTTTGTSSTTTTTTTDPSEDWDTALKSHSPPTPKSGLTINGIATSYLELHPTNPAEHHELILAHLWKTIISATGGWAGVDLRECELHDDGEEENNGLPPPGKGLGVAETSFGEVEADTPASEGEVWRAWREVGCVDLTGRGKSGRRRTRRRVLRLKPGYILSLLRDVVVVTEGVRGRKKVFTGEGVGRIAGVVEALREGQGVMDEDDYGDGDADFGKVVLEEVVRGVLKCVAPPEEGEDGGDTATLEGKIDPKRYIAYVGTLILQDHWESIRQTIVTAASTANHLSIPSFLERWRKEVPVECLAAAGVERLELELLTKGRWRRPSALTVAWVEPGEVVVASVVGEEGGENVVAGAAAAGAGKARGKWHEKFAAAKKRKAGGG
ncbi:hypothetical protein DFH27DRAFT_639946 [Peziza echinospora]|nr:hypothetical protein DFH27DRAFT_639946 [Peziza echinospora]